jgi:hypothetical protein
LISPERSLPVLALVIFLGGMSSDQLHALRDNVWTRVSDQKMNMVGRYHVIEHRHTKAFRKPSADNGGDRAFRKVSKPEVPALLVFGI